jgi:hypothetical protein
MKNKIKETAMRGSDEVKILEEDALIYYIGTHPTRRAGYSFYRAYFYLAIDSFHFR